MIPLLLASSLTFIEIALIIFVVVFLLIVVATMLGRSDRFDRAARIPLDDQTVETLRDTRDTRDTRDKPLAPDGARPAAADTDGGAR